MKLKLLLAALIITSLAGYLEWGGDNKAYVFELEGTILEKLFTNPASVLHPLILIPLAGQILLVVAILQRKPGKWWIYGGTGSIGILFLTILIAGLAGMNIKIIGSVLPFLVLAVWTIIWMRKSRNSQLDNLKQY